MIRTVAGAVAPLAFLAAPAFAAEPLVTPAELAAMLDDPDLVVIDVRSGLETSTDDSYAEGHIPGAVYANYKSAGWRTKVDGVPGMLPPLDRIEAMIAGLGVDSDDHVVITAAGAGSKALDMGAATRVYWTFKVLGHDEVSILDGGMKAWTAAGLPVSTEAASREPGDFTVDFQPRHLAVADDMVRGMTGAADLVDTRPANQYTGEKQSGMVSRPGTAPGAVSFPVNAMLDADGSHFLPASELGAKIDQIGVNLADEQIAFCNTGHHGAIGWFVMSELLGDRSVTLYDGSMAEWTASPGRPMVMGKGPMVGG